MSAPGPRRHVASPAKLLAHTLGGRRQELASAAVEVPCGGTTHRLAFDGHRYFADAHDEQAEAVLQAVGGVAPLCIRLVTAVGSATPPQLWSALAARQASSSSPDDDPLVALPESHLRVALARALHEEFLDAATPVRDAVAQLGLALLARDGARTELLAVKFQMTREFPHWDPGAGPWSDKELVLLARCMRSAAGEPRPHLELLPADPLARHAVAKYVVALLDPERTHSWPDLRVALSPTFRNVRALTNLLVAEGLLEHDDGRYRVRTRDRRPRRVPARRS